MNATAAIELQKYGEQPVDLAEWWELFDPRTEDEKDQDYRAEQERQYIEDCRVDYGGI